MTSNQFRSIPEMTLHMAEIMSDPVFQQALAIVKAEGESEDAGLGDDALASVRILAKQRGRASALSELINLTVPMPVEEAPRRADFGTGLSPDELEAAYAGTPVNPA